MYIQAERPYKDDKPFNTIHKIRERLANIECMVYEVFWANPYNNVYSVRISTDTEQGSGGTNGKGRNKLLALASAYAEFIERLQNRLLFSATSYPRFFLDTIKENSGFIYFPDEKKMIKDEFDQLPNDIMIDFFNEHQCSEFSKMYYDRLKENGYNGCIAVPFYDVKEGEIIHLPYNLLINLVGSNGMAAGNTTAEGVFQALCEIFERYAAFRVLNEMLTPPTIPKEFLMNFPVEFDIIRNIENNKNYEVIVKDFSTDENLPVLGLIVINKEKNMYRLNVGADTCFQVALNRCLTEIYQGSKDQAELDERMNPIQDEELDCFKYEDKENTMKRMAEYQQFTIDGTGKFPKSLFGDKESYTFDKAIFQTSKDYNHEVKRLTKHVLNMGHNIYMRDVSFLGFPSFIVYIPRMSPVGKKQISGFDTINLNDLVDLDKIEDLFFPFDAITDEKMRELAEILDNQNFNKIEMKEVLHLAFSEESVWHQIPVAYFLTLFYYKLDNIEKAIKSLEILMQVAGNEEDYYNTVLSFFKSKLKNKKFSLEEHKKQLLSMSCDKELTEEVITTFSDKSKLFSFIEIPKCPDCKYCGLSNVCLTKNSLHFLENMNKKLKNEKISQEKFREILL